MFRRLMVLCMVFAFAKGAIAHDAWLIRNGDNIVVIYGHGDKVEPYNPEKVKMIKAFDVAGRELASHVKIESDRLYITPQGDPYFAILYFDNGFWIKTADGYKNISKRDAKEFIESVHSVRFNKAILKWSDKLSEPLGMKMEIVPLKNPLLLKKGDTISIRVFLDGKPLEGASVYLNDNKEGVTDKDGMIDVRIVSTGFQIIGAYARIPLKDNPDADIFAIGTTITFTIE